MDGWMDGRVGLYLTAIHDRPKAPTGTGASLVASLTWILCPPSSRTRFSYFSSLEHRTPPRHLGFSVLWSGKELVGQERIDQRYDMTIMGRIMAGVTRVESALPFERAGNGLGWAVIGGG